MYLRLIGFTLLLFVLAAPTAAQETTPEPEIFLQPSIELTDTPVQGHDLSPDGRYLATWYSGGFTLREADTGAVLWQDTALAEGTIFLARWSPAGDRIAVLVYIPLETPQTVVYDVETGERLFELMLRDERADVANIDWSADGERLMTPSLTETDVYIWDGFTGEGLDAIEANSRLAVWSPDSTRLATVNMAGGQPELVVWNTESASPYQVLVTSLPAGSESHSVLWSADGTRLLAWWESDQDGRIMTEFMLVEVAQGTRLWTLELAGDYLSIEWAQERDLLLASSSFLCEECGEDVLLIDAASSEQRGVLPHEAAVEGASFSPDALQIVTVAEDMVTVWDAQTGQQKYTLDVDAPYAPRYSPDGRYLLTGGTNEPFRIWEADTGAPIGTLRDDLAFGLCTWYADSTRLFCRGVLSGGLIFDLRDLR